MNERKLKELFDAARKETPPVPQDGFDLLVMQAVRRESAPRAVTVFDQLNLLFPRLAWAAAGVIAVCVAGDLLAGSAQLPTLTDGVAQLSQEWLVDENGF